MSLGRPSIAWRRATLAALIGTLSLALLAVPGWAQQENAGAESRDASFRPLRLPFTRDHLAASNYGMSVFVWNNPRTTQRDLGTLTLAGFGWQKSLFSWREIEPQDKGLFDWREADRVVRASNQAGIRILARIDFSPGWSRHDNQWRNARPANLQDFDDFLRSFIQRYQAGSPYGRIHAVEIWNEPNLSKEWGTAVSPRSAADYVSMLRASYRTVKAIDPSMVVVTAGLSPTGWDDDTARPDNNYLQWMYDAGMSGSYDVLGVHGNGQAPDPAAEPGSLEGFPDGSFYFRRIEQLRAIQESNGDGSKAMWLLEFGWTSDAVHPEYKWFAVSEEQKAENIVGAIRYARANWPWMEVMHLWALPDPTWGPDREEYWWAVAEPDGTPRPALDLIVDAAQAGQLP